MKLEALEHPKTLELAAALGIELPAAIGHLELLWAFVGQLTPDGAVGKYSDAVIADKARWRGKPQTFVQALISTGWLDANADHRLLVHDWHDHCPNWVRAKLKKLNLTFALKQPLKNTSNEPSLDTSLEATNNGTNEASSCGRVIPSLTTTSHDKPCVTREAEVSRETISPEFEQFLEQTYPQTSHRCDWVTAAKSARGIVGLGLATEVELRRRLAGYRAFVESNGVSDPSKVAAPQNWFRLHDPAPYWAKEWAAVPTKAQRQQDANLATSLEWANRPEPTDAAH